jgi:AraC family transcriptional regulator
MGGSIIRDGSLMVIDYRCDARPTDIPYREVHARYSLSYVRRGSFGCRTLGREHQLLAGDS